MIYGQFQAGVGLRLMTKFTSLLYDKMHPELALIYKELEEVTRHAILAGYNAEAGGLKNNWLSSL